MLPRGNPSLVLVVVTAAWQCFLSLPIISLAGLRFIVTCYYLQGNYKDKEMAVKI
jgi:hypothetical protein